MKLRRVIVDLMQMKNRRFTFELLRNVPFSRKLLLNGRFDSIQNLFRRSFVKSDRDSVKIAVEPDLFDLWIFLDDSRDTRPDSQDFFHAGLDITDVAIKNILKT